MTVSLGMSNQNTEFTADFDDGTRVKMTVLQFLAVATALEQRRKEMEGDFSDKSLMDNVKGVKLVSDPKRKCLRRWAFWFGFKNALRKTTNDELLEYVMNKCKKD